MADPFNYQIFENVQTPQDFLSNIAETVESYGWTLDKSDISNNLELYLHSNGNGNQNLFFSMKMETPTGVPYALNICANTGFDGGQPYDSQPGKWFQTAVEGVDIVGGLAFPLNCLYVLVNSQICLVFIDVNAGNFPEASVGRLILAMGFGAIDSFKGDSETEGNYIFCWEVWTGYSSACSFFSAMLGVNDYGARVGLLYNGENKYNENIGNTVCKIFRFWSRNDGTSDFDDSMGSSTWGVKGYKYRNAVQFNAWASRTSLIKPIISIYHETTEDKFFYPIGELPYYACRAYPYYKAGDIIQQGTRKFMVFPILGYTNSWGVAVEVNA